MLISSICILFFLMCTLYLFFSLFTPTVGIAINSDGIYDYITADKGAGFIPKEAIVSLKLFGKENKEFLGISVMADYIEGLGLNRAAKREIQNNIASGTPAVVIRQCDINVSLSKLMKLMIKRFESGDAKELNDETAEQHEVVLVSEQKIEVADEHADTEVISLSEVEETSEAELTEKTDESDYPVLTVEDTVKRATTVEEMLAELLPSKKSDYSPVAIIDDDPGDGTDSFILGSFDDIAFTSDDDEDK